MTEMTERLANDPDLAARYRQAHEAYLRTRDEAEHVPEISGVTAGGMPRRVKCLHALVAHSLASGPGVNPFGDEALAQLDDWGLRGPCVADDGQTGRAPGMADDGQASRRLGVAADVGGSEPPDTREG
jgi:hypothetical protein